MSKHSRLFLFLFAISTAAFAQQPDATHETPDAVNTDSLRARDVGAAVPRFMRYSGVLKDDAGNPRTGVVGLTFALYDQTDGGAAIWQETQNVTLDDAGRYNVLLGATKSRGLPMEPFASGEARFIGVRVVEENAVEQPRVRLVSVPYALSAGDAQSLGGRPVSDFMLTKTAAQAAGLPTESSGAVSSAANTVNKVAKFTALDTLGDSLIFDNGTNVGIGTITPGTKLDVNGSVNSGGYLLGTNLFALSNNNQTKIFSGTAGTVIYDNTGGIQYGNFSSTGLNVIGNLQAATFNATTGFSLGGSLFAISNNNQTKFFSGTAGTVVYDNTGGIALGNFTPSGLFVTGSLNATTTVNATTSYSLGGSLFALFAGNQMRFYSGSAGTVIYDNSGAIPIGTFTAGGLAVTGALTSTGTVRSLSGGIMFPDGSTQLSAATTCSSNCGGTISGVTAGTGLAGGGITGTVNLSLVTPVSLANGGTGAATASGARTSLGAAALGANSDITSLTAVNSIALPATSNSSTGVITLGGTRFAHSFPAASANTFLGPNAGNFTLTSSSNTAVGSSALVNDTNGHSNTALGANTLSSNTTGAQNTAVGRDALTANAAGANNTAIGANTLSLNTASDEVAVGAYALNANTTGTRNVAVGKDALKAIAAGTDNTAIGYGTMATGDIGNFNTAMGSGALAANIAAGNTGVGYNALHANSGSGNNTALGYSALAVSNSASGSNTAMGASALAQNTLGENNTAVGYAALSFNSTGSNNIAIGNLAGDNATIGSNNIYIGNEGVAAEASTIRIGITGTQSASYIAGISGQTSSSGVAVLVNSSGKLGTTTSSIRAKEEVRDLAQVSRGVLRLRPVSFRYKPGYDDGTRLLQYGLIAEEVAQVMPELVAYGKDGRAETVRYHLLPPLLLNELQRQEKQLAATQVVLAKLRETLVVQASQIEELRTALRSVSRTARARHSRTNHRSGHPAAVKPHLSALSTHTAG